MSNETIDSTVPKTYIKLRLLKPFTCDVCQKKFFSKIHYHIHSVIHLLPDHFNCDECQEGFAHILNLDKHLGIHKNSMHIICHVCRREFSDVAALNEHVKKHNGEAANALIDEQNIVKKHIPIEEQNPFWCEKCNKRFPEKHHLDEHYESDCPEKLLKSNVVYEDFIPKSNFLITDDEELLFSDVFEIKDEVSSENSRAYDDVKAFAVDDEARGRQDEKTDVCSQNPLIKKQYEDSKFTFPKLKVLIPGGPSVSDSVDLREDAVSSESSQICKDVKSQTALKQRDNKRNACSQNPLNIKRFACELCKRVFLSKHSLAIHFSTHSGEKPFRCQLCEKTFGLKCLLNAHLRTHAEKKFFCGVCKKGFVSKDKLYDHVHIHALVRSYSCNFCDMTFSEKSLLDVHRRTHLPKKRRKPATCEICQKVLSSKTHLDNHMLVHTGARPFVCDICSKGFTSKANVLRHSLIHTGEKPFKCETCGASFNQRISLCRHRETHQRVGTEKDQQMGASVVLCSLCPEGQILKRSAKCRLCIHLENKPFKCETCEKSFATKIALKQHQFIHSGITPYICNICNKGFRQKPQLKRHHRVHTGEKPFLCELCGENFATQYSLQIHSNNHLEQKPFVCEVCQKGFASKPLLQAHTRIHTGEKPYACNVCDKRFRQSPHLYYHLRSIHGMEK